eukprot:TRINITY_DN13649_c4_g1_i1.p1 TRINITY_DN13649_c4_g1~~TRINITY_DN13649_c4_g1_i1.p1  ORF type:complete len:448 (+),score=100.09 TRINITY_DN13649_c4_g1_i1:70-1413(+)
MADDELQGNGALDELQDRLAWQKNAPLLYDMFFEVHMEWPALTVAWLGDEPDEPCRLAMGTQTDGSEGSQIIVAELTCTPDLELQGDPWKIWPSKLGQSTGFGCEPSESSGSPLRVVASMPHETGSEVNRILSCPQLPRFIAAKGSTGAVSIYDYKLALNAEAGSNPGLKASFSIQGKEPVDGFALAWSPLKEFYLATGGNDGGLSLWDVQSVKNGSSTSSLEPLHNFVAHETALNDLSFSFHQQLLVSVGDDGLLKRCDWRQSTCNSSWQVSNTDVLSVDWNPLDDFQVATAGKDKHVCIWDLRNMSSPLHRLVGHTDDVVAVKWCPQKVQAFSRSPSPMFLGSCSSDGQAILWNPDQEDEEVEEEDDDTGEPQAKEVVLSHRGHVKGVSDFSWGLVDNFLMCSVSEDHTLQIWQPASSFYMDELEEADEAAETEETQSKKRRLEE